MNKNNSKHMMFRQNIKAFSLKYYYHLIHLISRALHTCKDLCSTGGYAKGALPCITTNIMRCAFSWYSLNHSPKIFFPFSIINWNKYGDVMYGLRLSSCYFT